MFSNIQKYGSLTKFIGELCPQLDVDGNIQFMMSPQNALSLNSDELEQKKIQSAIRNFLSSYPEEKYQLVNILEELSNIQHSNGAVQGNPIIINELKRLKDMDTRFSNIKVNRVMLIAGGFGPPPDELVIDVKNKTIKQKATHSAFFDPNIQYQMTPHELLEMSNKLNALHMEYWSEDEYFSPVVDGEQWNLTINWSDNSITKIHGSNAYPVNFEELRGLFIDIDEKEYRVRKSDLSSILLFIPILQNIISMSDESLIKNFTESFKQYNKGGNYIDETNYYDVLFLEQNIDINGTSLYHVDVSELDAYYILALISAAIDINKTEKGTLGELFSNGTMLTWLNRIQSVSKYA
ncbi:hypothetical protein [Companilactobacillus ginsenosidimutans]|uniref:Uncharacterized protein n=1 Tax=Companilactobacillus ginsenosidimutans TaxID=1007676 RepID=A0A0H4QHK8_9LACO|nr:hypothetical protein [Companilactobacillus ginsenosidimutans]AKP67427.1 hypothetical protein ABM34_07695 [Companilactobacillus ginsenosidimutans]